VRAAELPYRAMLVAYQDQRDTMRNKRRTLALLDAARLVHAPSMTYGPKMGLPSRSAVHNRWKRLTVELKLGGRAPHTRREGPGEPRLDRWLTAHRDDLLGVGETLVDHREYLLTLLADPEQRQQLAEAIDHAGGEPGPTATAGFRRRRLLRHVLVAGQRSRCPPGGPGRAGGDRARDTAAERVHRTELPDCRRLRAGVIDVQRIESRSPR
jgi:hypothetical protein